MKRTRILIPALIIALLFTFVDTGTADESTTFTVYRKGKKLRYDADVGADVKEVILDYFDCETAKKVKTESVEAYFHLSDDREIINPDKLCKRCYQVFSIDKKGNKYFFRGIRKKKAPEAPAAAPATKEEILSALKPKVIKVSKEIAKIPQSAERSAMRRRMLITAEFTEAIHDFKDKELKQIAKIIIEESKLPLPHQYKVLKSFGWELYMAGGKPLRAGNREEANKLFEKAVIFYDKALEIRPKGFTAQYNKGLAYEAMRDSDRAIWSYCHAILIRPKLLYIKRITRILDDVQTTERLNQGKVKDLRRILDNIQLALSEGDRKNLEDNKKELKEFVDEVFADFEETGEKSPSEKGPPKKGPPEKGPPEKS
jgi:tetratricopeptide (TPR) repeat protein